MVQKQTLSKDENQSSLEAFGVPYELTSQQCMCTCLLTYEAESIMTI